MDDLEARREARRRRRMEELSALYQDDVPSTTSDSRSTVPTYQTREAQRDDSTERKRQERREAREARHRQEAASEESTTTSRRSRRREQEESAHEEATEPTPEEHHEDTSAAEEAVAREREEEERRQAEEARRLIEEHKRAEERRRQAAEDEERRLREEAEAAAEEARRRHEEMNKNADTYDDESCEPFYEMEDSGYQEAALHNLDIENTNLDKHDKHYQTEISDDTDAVKPEHSDSEHDCSLDDISPSKLDKWKKWEIDNKRDSEYIGVIPASSASVEKRETVIRRLKQQTVTEGIDETAKWVKTKKDTRHVQKEFRTLQPSTKGVGNYRAEFESKIISHLDSSPKASRLDRKIVGTSSLRDLQKRFETGAGSKSSNDVTVHNSSSSSNMKVLKVSPYKSTYLDSPPSHEKTECLKQKLGLERDGQSEKSILPDEKSKVMYGSSSPNVKDFDEGLDERNISCHDDENVQEILVVAEENRPMHSEVFSNEYKRSKSKEQQEELLDIHDNEIDKTDRADSFDDQQTSGVTSDELLAEEEEREEQERLERERRKEEIAKKKEEEEQRKKGKRKGLGGLNPEKKKLLKDETPTKLQDESEKRRILRQRIKPLPDLKKLSTADLQKLCKDMHAKVASLEEDVYDNEMKIRKQAWEINELTLKVNDTKGKFIKPVLRKINKTEGKLGKLQKEREDFRSNLKSTGQHKYAIEDETPKTPDLRENLGRREDEQKTAE